MPRAVLDSARVLMAFVVGAVLSGCNGPIRTATDLPATDEFAPAGCIEIVDYADHAMEPFMSADGTTLLFNNRNAPAERTDLHWATRIDASHFKYAGPLQGANSDTLDAVPSLDGAGLLYFVSLRSYRDSHATLYRGTWSAGRITSVALVPGVTGDAAGLLNFDVEISHDGNTLYFVDGRFDGGAVPESADIVVAHQQGNGFVRDAQSRELLAAVNTGALEYAPAIAADGLELYFTRLDMHRREIGLYRVTRTDTGSPFGSPERLAGAAGFVEAPALSGDGRTLYFHRLDNGKFHICRLVR